MEAPIELKIHKGRKNPPVLVKHGKTDYPATLVPPSPNDAVVEDGKVRIKWDSTREIEDVDQRDVRGVFEDLPRRKRQEPQRLRYDGILCCKPEPKGGLSTSSSSSSALVPKLKHNLMVEGERTKSSHANTITTKQKLNTGSSSRYIRAHEEVWNKKCSPESVRGTSSDDDLDVIEDGVRGKTVHRADRRPSRRRKRVEPSSRRETFNSITNRLGASQKFTPAGGGNHPPNNVYQDSSSSGTIDLNEERSSNSSSSETDEDERKTLCPQNAAAALKNIPGIDPDEVDTALKKIWPKSRLQTAMARIHKARQSQVIYIGFKVRKFFLGKEYGGLVVGGPHFNSKEQQSIDSSVDTWSVQYDDHDSEHMTYDNLIRWRADRPELPATCRGRPLHMLELFCGCAVVSQEFTQLKWKIDSIDVLENSNATIKKDILNLKYADLQSVPDFIWASLPFETYSDAPENRHRSTKTGNLDESQKARDHNFIFLKMAEILTWAKKKHPHLIVVIKNPVGILRKMPLMKEFIERFELDSTTVNYCAFGRNEMKPTMIWTNDYGLKHSLQEFTCEEKCHFGNRRGEHHVQVNHGTRDYSIIPQPLAEEVAEYVNAKFVIDRIRKRKVALLNNEED